MVAKQSGDNPFGVVVSEQSFREVAVFGRHLLTAEVRREHLDHVQLGASLQVLSTGQLPLEWLYLVGKPQDVEVADVRRLEQGDRVV
jgi:hypothetical protein